MTVDEFKASVYYTPEADAVLADLTERYGDFIISPPVIPLDGDTRKCCKSMVRNNGHLMVTTLRRKPHHLLMFDP